MADDAIALHEPHQRARSRSSRSSSITCPAATHAPHHPTPEWIKKISDMHLFDKGWNALRDEIFANQKKLGVIPQDAKLTPWPDDLLKRWDALTADEKKMFLRQVDVFAAYLAYTDHEIGRVIQAVENHGQARQHADHLHQRRQRQQRRGHADRHAERGGDVQRRRTCRSRTSSSTSTTSGARTRPTRTWRCRGRGRSTRRSRGPSRSPRTSAARGRAWRSPGRR